MAGTVILEKNIASLFYRHHLRLSICLPNKTAKVIKQNWSQFPLVVKATTLKQQISKFYLQIQRTDAGDHI